MQPLSSGQSLCIDGLPVELYQQFWNLIGMDLSGQLYSLMIEPLLLRLKKDLKGIAFQNGSESVKLVLSACR